MVYSLIFPSISTILLPWGSKRVVWILEDDDKDVWIATLDHGLYMYNRQTAGLTRFLHDPQNPTSLANDQVYSLYQDSKGRIWVVYWAIAKAGLSILNEDKVSFTYVNVPSDPSSLSSSLVNSVYEDRSESSG